MALLSGDAVSLWINHSESLSNYYAYGIIDGLPLINLSKATVFYLEWIGLNSPMPDEALGKFSFLPNPVKSLVVPWDSRFLKDSIAA